MARRPRSVHPHVHDHVNFHVYAHVSRLPSRLTSDSPFADALEQHGVPGVSQRDVDVPTARALTSACRLHVNTALRPGSHCMRHELRPARVNGCCVKHWMRHALCPAGVKRCATQQRYVTTRCCVADHMLHALQSLQCPRSKRHASNVKQTSSQHQGAEACYTLNASCVQPCSSRYRRSVHCLPQGRSP